MNFPKAPKHQIYWGIIDSNCEAATKDWIKSVIDMVTSGRASIEEAAEEIYKEIRSLGYSEGYDSAQADIQDGSSY